VPSGVFYWDMGLQKILLVEYMAQILHPDLFQDLDMVQELMNFYQEFYGYSLTAPEAQAILSRQLP
jgi:iron complex transport system substrate-binding protein